MAQNSFPSWWLDQLEASWSSASTSSLAERFVALSRPDGVPFHVDDIAESWLSLDLLNQLVFRSPGYQSSVLLEPEAFIDDSNGRSDANNMQAVFFLLSRKIGDFGLFEELQPKGEKVQLNLHRSSRELLSGLVCPWSELIRFQSDRPLLSDTLRSSPLLIPTEVWRKSDRDSRRAILSLERSIAESNCEHTIDGDYEVDLASLGFGLNQLNLIDRVKFFVTQGKKLRECGYLEDITRDTCGLDSNWFEGSSIVNFRISQQYLPLLRRTANESSLLQSYREQITSDEVDLLLQHLLKESDGQGQFRELWWRLVNIRYDSEREVVLREPNGRLLDSRLLLWEMYVRSHGQSQVSIPEELGYILRSDWFSPESMNEPHRMLEEFNDILNTKEMQSFFVDRPYATIASTASQRAGWDGTIVVTDSSPERSAEVDTDPPVATKKEPTLKLEVVPDSTETTEEPGGLKFTGVFNRERSVQAKMRQLAAKELETFRANDPALFQSIRRKYLDSLDDQNRRILAEVEARMSRDGFEKQFSQKLVKFMVDNPGAWKSSRRG